MKKITYSDIRKASREFEVFIKKARRKLLEAEILQSEWEIQNGKGKVYKSADDFMAHISKKLKPRRK